MTFEAQTGLLRQFLAGYSACLLSVAYGGVVGWIAPIQTFLESDRSPVGKLTEYQIACVATIPYAGALIGIFLFAPINGRIGRKTMFYILATVYLVAALVIYFTRSYILMLVTRLCTGVCIPGTLSSISLYISEMSDPSIRGNLGSGLIVFCNSGVVIMCIASTFLSYHPYNLISIALPTIFMLIFCRMPESPVYYLKEDRLTECRQALSWFKGTTCVTAIDAEVEKLRAMFFDQQSGPRTQLTWSEVFRTKYYTKAFLLGIVLQSSVCCSGIMIMQTFSYTIIAHCLDGVHPGFYPIYMMIASCVAGVISLFLMHHFSRKFVACGTRFLCGASLLIVGVLLLLKDHFNVRIPSVYFLVMFGVYFIGFGLGLASITFVVFGELFSVECRDKFMQPLLLLHFGLFTVYVLLYPITVIKIQIYSWIFIFGITTIILSVILMIYLPETSNKTISEIAQELTVSSKSSSNKKKENGSAQSANTP